MSSPGKRKRLIVKRWAALSVLQVASFRRIWLAELLSGLGSHISRLGLLLYLFHSTNNTKALATLLALEMLPGAIVAPVSGALIDRLSRRKIMIASDLARMVFMLTILAYPTQGVIYCMAALHSISAAFFDPAKTASIPLLIESDQLTEANGIGQSTSNVMLVVGPVLGTQLFMGAGLQTMLVIDALTFLASALLIARVEIPERDLPEGATLNSISIEIATGWIYLTRHRLIRYLIALFFISLTCVGTWLPLAPFFIKSFLRGSDLVLGIQLGMLGVGGVLGGTLAPKLIKRYNKGVVLFASLLAEGLIMIVYSFVADVGLSVFICLLWGGGVSVMLVSYYSIMQELVDKKFSGRAFSLAKQSENLAILLAAGLAAVLSMYLSVDQIFTLGGITYLAIVLASAFTAPGRNLLATR
ncbi:MAG TPA: MFS transporter [Blastocatellia bacterium]|nr:MFS transporter [Blastocatellia bacterium]